MRYLLLVALATALVCGGCKDNSNSSNPDASTDTDTDTDADTDTDTDTDTDSDTDTEPVNPCPDGQYAACYGNDVWCHDSADDTPLSELDVCVGGELCVVLTPEVAECQCVPDSYTQCHNGDVWSYDSCGEFDVLVLECEAPASCKDISSTVADCCQSAAYEQCGTDENVHEFEACELTGDVEEALITDCPDNADCVNDTTTSASCQCRNEWYGTDCELCPAHWDPDADCGACAGYWTSTATNCNTCSGYGTTGHCQCPSSDYVPQPNSENCWTCPFPDITTTGGVCPSSGSDISWTDADTGCPAGFRLPTPEETATLFSNCITDTTGISCDSCLNSTVCDSMYPLTPYFTWTSDSCSGGYVPFSFSNGDVYWGACLADSISSNVRAICIGD